MKRINPNLLKLAEKTSDPNFKPVKLEEKVEDTPINDAEEIKGYIYVPSIKLYVAEERSFQGKN